MKNYLLKKSNQGFTLIELIVFIVVVGIVLTGSFIALNTTSEKSSNAYNQLRAILLAQERMELVLGFRRLQGFTNLADPCTTMATPPAICTLPAGFTLSGGSAGVANTTINGDSNYKIISVVVNGPGNTSATLATLVGS